MALGAESVLATDIDEDALRRTRLAANNTVQTSRFDFLDLTIPLPAADLAVAADCSYTAAQAESIGRRAAEAIARGSRVAIADSQRWRWQTFLNQLPISQGQVTTLYVRSAIRYRVDVFYFNPAGDKSQSTTRT